MIVTGKIVAIITCLLLVIKNDHAVYAISRIQGNKVFKYSGHSVVPPTTIANVPSVWKGAESKLRSLSAFSTSKSSSALYDIDTPAPILVSNEGSTDAQVTKKRWLLVLIAIMYGTNYGVQRKLQEGLSNSIISCIRFILPTAFFFPRIISRGKTSQNIGAIIAGMELGMYSAVGWYAQTILLSQGFAASKVAFAASLSVLFVPLLQFLFRGKNNKLKSSDNKKNEYLLNLVPAFLAVLGVGILELSGVGGPAWKDLLLLITPASFGTCFWRTEQLSKTYKNEQSSIVGGMMIPCALSSMVWGAMDGSLSKFSTIYLPFLATSPLAALFMLYLAIVSTGWTAYQEQKAVQHVSAAEVTLIYSLEPLGATLISAMYLGETLTTNTGYGAAFIILACILDTLGVQELVKNMRNMKQKLTQDKLQ